MDEIFNHSKTTKKEFKPMAIFKSEMAVMTVKVGAVVCLIIAGATLFVLLGKLSALEHIQTSIDNKEATYFLVESIRWGNMETWGVIALICSAIITTVVVLTFLITEVVIDLFQSS